MTQAKITIKSSGPMSLSLGGRKYLKGKPATITDVGDIRLAQRHSALDVKIVKGSMPKAPPTSEPPPPPGSDDDSGEELGGYSAEDLLSQTKATLCQLGEEEFGLELSMSATKEALVEQILAAQTASGNEEETGDDEDDAETEDGGDADEETSQE